MKKKVMEPKEFISWLEKEAENDAKVQLPDFSKVEDLKKWACNEFFPTHAGKYVKTFLLENLCGDEDDKKNVNSKQRAANISLFEQYLEFSKQNMEISNDFSANMLSVESDSFTKEDAQKIYEQSKAYLKETSTIKIVDSFQIYNDIPVVYSDGFKIKKNEKNPLATSLCIVLNKEDLVVAVGKLTEDALEYRIVMDSNNIEYDLLKNTSKFQMILFPKAFDGIAYADKVTGKWKKDMEVYSVKVRLGISELPRSDKPLCIDFGTSNTTVGTYGVDKDSTDKITCVEFEYNQGNDVCRSKLLPTMAYVKSCKDRDNIEFLFGYAAREKVIAEKYDTDATVYFELKRWITELNQPEKKLEDEEGNICENVDRSIIIKKYLEYVIHLAECYFKCKFNQLHFSAPVKLKEVFIREIQKMLPDYQVYSGSDCLDEGIAIVYDYIANEIDSEIENNKIGGDSKEYGKENTILILDCGGGTTDLVNCHYSYDMNINNGDAKLNVSAQFENGNPNFGGNNITFRILQLIKIKMVAALYDEIVDSEIDNLIPFSEAAMLDEIDKNVENEIRPLVGKIYESFEAEYEKCEEYIPTKYAESEFYKSASKRNYFYLWQLAEKIKVEFYKQANLATYNLENRISVEKINDFYLYRYDTKSEEINQLSDIPSIEVTNNEIKKIIYADIYAVMSDLFINIDINSFNQYKLSGQSCKVTLFQELLKEFITGRKLRGTNLKTSNKPENLKLGCINGCIAFTRSVKRGEIVPDRGISVRKPKPIYTVAVVTKKVVKIFSPEKPYGGNVFDGGADELRIEVRNSQNELSRPIIEFKPTHNYDNTERSMSDIKNLIKEYSEISDEDLDKLCGSLEAIELVEQKDAVIIFATLSKVGYGFNIFELYVRCDRENTARKHHYYLPKAASGNSYSPQYENFESVMTTFFDGHR